MDKTPKPDYKFETLEPTSRAVAGEDFVRVFKNGLGFSQVAKKRLGLKDNGAISVQVSSDGSAIKLTLGGAFRISLKSRQDTPKAEPRAHINSVAIPQKAPMGVYLYRGDDLYVAEGK